MKLAEYKEFFPARHCAYCQEFFVAGRSDARTCSASCRTMLSRRKRNPTPCHQKIKRDEEARASPRPQDTVIDYRIEAIGTREAADFIKRYEFLGTVGRSLARYGAAQRQGRACGVAVFGTPSKFPAIASSCWNAARAHIGRTLMPRRGSFRERSRWPRPIMAGKSSSPTPIPPPEKLGPSTKRAIGFTRGGRRTEPSTVRRDRAIISRRQGGRVISDKAFYKRGLTMADVKSGAWRRVRKSAKHRYVRIEAPTRRERRALAAQFTALTYPKRPWSL